jgi:Trk K+ transport system NAD-binding subunit
MTVSAQTRPAPTPDDPDAAPRDATSRHGLIVVGAGGAGLGVVEQTVHSMSVTLIDKERRREDLAREVPGARCIHGDGTSLLVLRDAGVDAAYALVAATSDDAVNIEACRLAVSCGVPTVFCRLHDPALRARVLAVGAIPVTVQQALSRAIISQLPGIAVTTSEVGLGQGEILQVRVTAGSLAIGHTLKEIGTREFLVAAIYRRGTLVVPHGDTVVEADDQVLLVGPPDTLRAVAEYFRVGTAQFPLQYGRNIVVWDRSRTHEVLAEAQWVKENTRVEGGLYRVSGDDPADAGPLTCPFDVLPLNLDLRESAQFAGLDSIHPGLYVVRAPFRRWLQRCGMTPIRPLLANAKAPILMARGTVPYRRILAPIGDSDTAWVGVELAIDVARQLDATVTFLHARPPQFVAGAQGEERSVRILKQAEDIARRYNIDIHVREVEGNPIKQAQKAALDHQLCIVARRREQQNSYLRPDVGLRIALGVSCSSLLLSIG